MTWSNNLNDNFQSPKYKNYLIVSIEHNYYLNY